MEKIWNFGGIPLAMLMRGSVDLCSKFLGVDLNSTSYRIRCYPSRPGSASAVEHGLDVAVNAKIRRSADADTESDDN